MRFTRLCALPFVLLAAPLAAQGFEGTISMKVSGDQSQTINWSFKGPMASASITPAAGGAANANLIIDNTAHTSTTLLPFSAGVNGSPQTLNGIAMVSALSAPTVAGVAPKPSFKKLGTSEDIGGLKCDDYDLNDAAHTHACLTDALGAFVYPTASLGGGMAALPMMAGGPGFSFGGDAPPNGVKRSVQILPNGAQIITQSDGGGGASAGAGGAVFAAGGGMGGGGGDTSAVMVFAKKDQNGTTNNVRIATANDGSVTVNNNGEVTTYPSMAAAGGVMPGGAMITRGPAGPRAPTWATALRGGLFPLKVWAADGSSILEVTEIQHTAVSDGAFTIPDGYQQAGGGGATMIRSGGGN